MVVRFLALVSLFFVTFSVSAIGIDDTIIAYGSGGSDSTTSGDCGVDVNESNEETCSDADVTSTEVCEMPPACDE